MRSDRQALANIVRDTQAKYRAAWERYRRDQTETARQEMERAQRELDDVQRVAITETVAIATRR